MHNDNPVTKQLVKIYVDDNVRFSTSSKFLSSHRFGSWPIKSSNFKEKDRLPWSNNLYNLLWSFNMTQKSDVLNDLIFDYLLKWNINWYDIILWNDNMLLWSKFVMKTSGITCEESLPS